MYHGITFFTAQIVHVLQLSHICHRLPLSVLYCRYMLVDLHVYGYSSYKDLVHYVDIVFVVAVVVVIAVSYDLAAVIVALAFALKKVVLICCCFYVVAVRVLVV